MIAEDWLTSAEIDRCFVIQAEVRVIFHDVECEAKIS